MLKLTDIVDIGGTRRRTISLVRDVRTLLELHAAHKLGNGEDDIRIATGVRAPKKVTVLS